MSKVITLLGSTGSIGTQSLDVCRMHGYEVFGLSANSSVDKLLAQIAEFHPKYVAVTDPAAFDKLSAALAGAGRRAEAAQGRGRTARTGLYGRSGHGAERRCWHCGPRRLAGRD